jgi:hypothetical protein
VSPSLAYLGLDEFGFGRRVVEAAKARGMSCVVLSLDAPLRNRPVTIGPGEVVWEGTDLLGVGAIVVESPLFPWPQPQLPEVLSFEPPVPGARISPEREARALATSALWIASEGRLVWNPPGSACLAASPAIALDRLDHAGLPVHSWRLEPSAGQDQAGCVVVDCAGRDRWHRPAAPAPGEPALVLDPTEGEILDLLVVGGRLAGARGHRSEDVPPEAADLAARAAQSLNLAIAAVSIAGPSGSPEVLMVEAGPGLAEWDTRLGGRLAPLLIERLEAAAHGAQP